MSRTRREVYEDCSKCGSKIESGKNSGEDVKCDGCGKKINEDTDYIATCEGLALGTRGFGDAMDDGFDFAMDDEDYCCVKCFIKAFNKAFNLLNKKRKKRKKK